VYFSEEQILYSIEKSELFRILRGDRTSHPRRNPAKSRETWAPEARASFAVSL